MSEEINPLPPHPKPKSKGKKPDPPKLNVGPSIEELDPFKVMFGYDAGSDTPQEFDDSFRHRFKKSDLLKQKKTERKVIRISTRLLEREITLEERVDEPQEPIQQQGLSEEANIQMKIKEKLDGLEIQETDFSSSGKLRKVKVENRWMSIRTFIEVFFQEELKEVKSLLEQGIPLRVDGKRRPRDIIQSYLSDYLL